MICAVPALTISDDGEAAYPNSILDDAHTRQTFKAIYPETVDETPPQLGFWRRQFSGKLTPWQELYDWHFSVILPVICFACDPGIFRSEHALLGRFAPVAIPLSYIAVMGTMLWLMMGNRLGWLNSWLSGVFAISAVASLAIGVVLFPFSLLGMLVMIGFLGFTPLLLSFSLFRNAVRAYRAANART